MNCEANTKDDGWASSPDDKWLRDLLEDITPETESVTVSASYAKQMATELLHLRRAVSSEDVHREERT